MPSPVKKAAETPAPSPAPTSKASPHFLFKEPDIAKYLALQSNGSILEVVLSPSFLDPWTGFRDSVPLKPNIKIDLGVTDHDIMQNYINTVYDCMDSVPTCKFDRPTAAETASWTVEQQSTCLVYQACCNLAREGEIFSEVFERKNLKNENGRSKARRRIQGIVMMVFNLTYTYTALGPSRAIVDIEASRPAANPEFSPIPRTQRMHILNNMTVEKLREAYLRPKVRGANEKAWLIALIMREEGLASKEDAEAKPSTVTRKVANSMGTAETVGVKRQGEVTASYVEKKHNLNEVINVD